MVVNFLLYFDDGDITFYWIVVIRVLHSFLIGSF